MISHIIIELFNAYTDIVAEALYPRRVEVVRNLLEKYNLPSMATFAGSLIRLYTKSNVNNICTYFNNCIYIEIN